MTRRSSILLLCMICSVFACLASASEKTAAAIREHHSASVALWWTGNAGWLIKSNDLLVATDLALESEDKVQPPPVTAADIAPFLDVLFVTHHHGDHCNSETIHELLRKGKCVFVLPSPCLKELGNIAIPRERLIVPEPLQPFTVKGVRVEPIHAIHGNQEFTVLTREPDFVDNIAHNCGYVLTIQGKRFLQPGDSVLTEEHLALSNIDVLFVSPTVHDMYLDRSVVLINHLQPLYIFPQHFGTYKEVDDELFWRRGYPDELRLALFPLLQQRYHKLRQGEMFELK